MQRVLSPIIHKDAYMRATELELIAWFREAIFLPLVVVLAEHDIPSKIKTDDTQRSNEEASAVVAALRSGRVHYANGVFSGRFSAAISRELRAMGARFDKATKTFRVTQDQLPYYIRGAIAESIFNSTDAHTAVLAALAEVERNLASASAGLALDKALNAVLRDLHRQFADSVSPVPGMALPMDLTEEQKAKIADDFINNLDLYIKDFAAERIPLLRERVLQNVAAGARTDRLAKILEAEFGVSQRKAEFLADQETGLLVSKYRQARYDSIGVQEYIWSTSQDERVRPDHVALHNRRFSYSQPPITDRATGRRNNPGEDYRCRCVAKPIVSFVPA